MKHTLAYLLMTIAVLIVFSAKGQHGIAYKLTQNGGTFTEGGPATNTNISANRLCTDAAGNIYVGTSYGVHLYKIDAATNHIVTFAGNPSLSDGFSGDGGPAIVAQIGRTIIGLCTDHAGNVLFCDRDNYRIRKINTTTGIITTIAGGGTDATSSGIPATSAQLYYMNGMHIESADNVYYTEATGSNRIRKISSSTGNISTVSTVSTGAFAIAGDNQGNIFFTTYNTSSYSSDPNAYIKIQKYTSSGVLSTIAGNPYRMGYSTYTYGDGGPASDASVAPNCLYADTAGNVYISEGPIRRIDATTGIITSVAGSYFQGSVATLSGIPEDSLSVNAIDIKVTPSGTVYYVNYDDNSVCKITSVASDILTASITDSLNTTPCTLPATHSLGVYGTVNGVPAYGDSVHLAIDYGDGSALVYMTAPYWYSGGTYGFGSTASWLPPHTYAAPGPRQPLVYLKTLGRSYTERFLPPTIRVGSTCDSGVTGVAIVHSWDSVITAKCVSPAIISYNFSGVVSGRPTAYDSVYVNYNYGYAGTWHYQTRVFPLTMAISGTDTTYTFSYSGYDTVNITGTGGAMYSHGVELFSNSGDVTNNYGIGSTFHYIYDCSYSRTYTTLTSSTYPLCATSNMSFDLQGMPYGAADTGAFVPFYINWGDGSDTVVNASMIAFYDPFYYTATGIPHTYYIPGDYDIFYRPLDTGTIDYGMYFYSTHIDSPCIPVTGRFYNDLNGNCVLDSGETLLAYWPYTMVNTTTSDTTYGWCDAAGYYVIPLNPGSSYSISPGVSSSTTASSLVVACPSTGVYTITAASGSAYSQDFGFVCGSTTYVDMSVSGWARGFIPGDTGVIGIWSSDDWGYHCDTPSSTVTLTLDSRLTYAGMWSGPAPTSISGSTLSWTGTTTGSLFDFHADVKVFTATTATLSDTLLNRLRVTPTGVADPDTSNNTYLWRAPVRSSWDPNDKQVSPLGYGTDGYIPSGTQLSYHINFQNMGTASARNVTVVDSISDNLDISTLQIIGSSANVIVYTLPGNVVRFRFNDIYLPDSGSDMAGSKGYISYAILPKAHVAGGAQILNRAGIYFDYNPPVYTNATLNTIEDTSVISGPSSVCMGSTITLTTTIPGGIWHASNGNASVSGGLVTAIAAGIDTITYIAYGGDLVLTKVITVGATGSAGTITGASAVCVGASTTLSPSISGGSWSSLATGIASVSGGVVYGVGAGVDTIVYSVSGSCGTVSTNAIITVNPLPVAGTMTGTTTACAGATTTLSAGTGGTWSSGSTSIASVSSAGVVTGIAAGTATISYTVTNSCGTDLTAATVTINPLPSAGTITGTTTACVAATTTLTATGSGTWTSSSTSTASVSTTGVVTGVAAGTAVISYSVTNSCGTDVATATVTINPLPSAGTITGTTTVCVAATTTLSAAGSGSWSSASTSITSVSTTGVVSGIAAGSTTISYTVTNSCGTDVATTTITVNPLPVAGTITGSDSVCVGSAITLSASGSSGTTSTWTLSNTTATIAGMVVTGAYTGTDTAIHTSSNSCGTVSATKVITIMPLPDPGTLTGADSVCAGATITLAETVTGGTWSISGTSATIVSGVVTGASAGTSVVTYSVGNYCGTAIRVHPIVTNPLPVAGTLSGTTIVCEAATTTITPSVTGGTWSSSVAATATVDTTGLVTGVAAGAVTISYAITNSCGTDVATISVTVNPLPTIGSISGPDSICVGDTMVLADAATGGVWTTSNAGIASVSGTGQVTGISSGLATITYTTSNSCGIIDTTHDVFVKSVADCNTGLLLQTSSSHPIAVYPNPNSGTFIIELPSDATNVTICVTDVSGKTITEIQPKNARGLKVPVHLNSVSGGTYLLITTIDNRIYHDKIVVW